MHDDPHPLPQRAGRMRPRDWNAMVVGDARNAIARWRGDGTLRTVATWGCVSAAIAVALIVATGVVAAFSPPDGDVVLPGVSGPATADDYRYVVTGNLMVLALHALACSAAYLARRSLAFETAGYGGFWRVLNSGVGKGAMVFVGLATIFSFVTQARLAGGHAATLAAQLELSPPVLLVAIAPHAVPELTALFLPLAAWMVSGLRRRRWNDLLAAAALTSVVAVPVVALSALVELWVTPHIVSAIVG